MIKGRGAFAAGVILAAIDGGLLAIWGLIAKFLGNTTPNILSYALVLFTAGACYLALAKISKPSERIIKADKLIFYLIAAFTIISVIQFGLAVFIFEFKDAEIAVAALMRNSSLIFAALICHFAWLYPAICKQVKIDLRIIVGICIFTFGCWLFVGMPNSLNQWREAISVWGALSILVGLNRAITEVLTLKLNRQSNAFTMNQLTGIGLICLSFPAILAYLISGYTLPSSYQLLLIFLIGGIIPLTQAFRFLSYNYLKDIIGKKGIAILASLIVSFIFGITLGESFSIEKIGGLLFAIAAIVILEDGFFKMLYNKPAQQKAN